MSFTLEHTDKQTQARAGVLQTDRGAIQTPIFMPVGTLGTVKTIQQFDLHDEINAQIILGNTYHLYLRPGIELLQEAGGLHQFINWIKPILTDSGGYQVYSLAARRKIKEEGVTFSSHIDGSKHFFSPENVMQIQNKIGADIIMAFDECTPYPCDFQYARRSLDMTHRWLDRCFDVIGQYKKAYSCKQILAPIVQGSVYPDLRKKSAEYISTKDSAVYAIGGLSVGEPHEDMYSMTQVCTSILPKQSARYLMGVGTPINLLECISRGIDMFDCVLPTRNARHGLLYTSEGVINIKNNKWKNDFSAIDPNGTVKSDHFYSKAYLRHLFIAKEALGAQIASLHNLGFYLWLMKEARSAIQEDRFKPWKEDMVLRMSKRL
jgi:queuine tRNA-ribosyltransferase